ncbi:MAG: hypothetical protein Q4B05_02405 [Candidatus Saccharibacteria bacterium]|nr:hypothetical protein [Candidatus Saccharibacteria bacterium]
MELPATPRRTRGSLIRDVFTWPNVISAIGYRLVHRGSQQLTTPRGVAEVAVGRALDLADGAVARATGQETDLGAAVDASLDKLGMGKILLEAWRTKAAPRPLLAAIALFNVTNGVASLIASTRHPEESYRPPRSGKLAMALSNAALLSHCIGTASEHISGREASRRSERWRQLGTAAFAAYLPLAVHAAGHYIRRAAMPRRADDAPSAHR